MPELETISLARVCRGDPAAWRDFVDAAGPVLRGAAQRLLVPAGRGDDVAEVLQEIFLRLVRNEFRLLKRYDPQRAKLRTWLGVIAASATVDWLRRLPPVHEALSELPEYRLPAAPAPADPDPPPVEIPAGLLSARQALVLKLLYCDDRDVSEVAGLLRIEPQTVRSLRHKAISRLRKALIGDA